MKQSKLILLAALIFAPAIAHAVTVITSLPYTITSGGSYVLESSLTAPTGDGIDVNASNVSIDLGGYTILANNGLGINVSGSDVSIQNGTINSPNGAGVSSNGGSNYVLRNVHVFGRDGVVFYEVNGFRIENCFIVVTISGGFNSIGIEADSCSGSILIKNNTIIASGSPAEHGIGLAYSVPGLLTGNSETNFDIGLNLFSGAKYQGNITTNCPTPVLGGTAVGHENG